jgi:hypothetical protein
MMESTYASNYFYRFSKDFDYRSYLETKSHFDRVQMSGDSGIRRILASDAELARSQIDSINGVGPKIDEIGLKIETGFEEVSVSIDAVKESIDDLRSICEYGFGEITLGLNNIDRSLSQLIEIARTPDQTWALEQFSIAQTAFQRNLFAEALDYLNRAIDGHGTNAGYTLEHRFHTCGALSTWETTGIMTRR